MVNFTQIAYIFKMSELKTKIVKYKASRTGARFHQSQKFVRLIMGPIGSGKSVASCHELFRLGMLQEPGSDGVRRTRFAIIRNTYRELIDTTCKTWFDWFPKSLGTWRQLDMTHRIMGLLKDGTRVDMEILFRALDKPSDIKKLLSLELTGGWMNEAREIPKQILDALIGRCGRYPPPKDGVMATWHGVILDTNPPDDDSWIYRTFEEELPETWEIFHQPSGLSDEAENIQNLIPGYYDNMIAGKDPEWIKVYVHGKYGFVSDGMPVVPEFHDHVHVTEYEIEFVSDVLLIGVDFGRTPAATFGQEINGQIQIVDELTTFGIGATHFANLLKERIKGHFPNVEILCTADPAGDNPGEQVEETCIEILQNAGIPCDPAHTNNFIIRRESLSVPLTTLGMDGKPQLVISPKCHMLRKGLNGAYKYKRVNVSGERFQNKPDKTAHSHVCESLQYLMLGSGRGYDVISSNSNIDVYKVVGLANARRNRAKVS